MKTTRKSNSKLGVPKPTINWIPSCALKFNFLISFLLVKFNYGEDFFGLCLCVNVEHFINLSISIRWVANTSRTMETVTMVKEDFFVHYRINHNRRGEKIGDLKWVERKNNTTKSKRERPIVEWFWEIISLNWNWVFFSILFLVSSRVHSVNNPKGIDRKFMFASQQQKVDALIDFLTFWHNNEKCCLCRRFNRNPRCAEKRSTKVNLPVTSFSRDFFAYLLPPIFLASSDAS
jgi:hypothetical protein